LRDIAALVGRGILVRNPEGGRSTRYSLAKVTWEFVDLVGREDPSVPSVLPYEGHWEKEAYGATIAHKRRRTVGWVPIPKKRGTNEGLGTKLGTTDRFLRHWLAVRYLRI